MGTSVVWAPSSRLALGHFRCNKRQATSETRHQQVHGGLLRNGLHSGDSDGNLTPHFAIALSSWPFRLSSKSSRSPVR